MTDLEKRMLPIEGAPRIKTTHYFRFPPFSSNCMEDECCSLDADESDLDSVFDRSSAHGSPAPLCGYGAIGLDSSDDMECGMCSLDCFNGDECNPPNMWDEATLAAEQDDNMDNYEMSSSEGELTDEMEALNNDDTDDSEPQSDEDMFGGELPALRQKRPITISSSSEPATPEHIRKMARLQARLSSGSNSTPSSSCDHKCRMRRGASHKVMKICLGVSCQHCGKSGQLPYHHHQNQQHQSTSERWHGYKPDLAVVQTQPRAVAVITKAACDVGQWITLHTLCKHHHL
uniref:Virion phosphoprotein n=1 Tax=Otarine gammaherpesvirus 4 TaxID=2801541 RepID=A0A889IW79_9GAMA|nr:Virion phosphoprotein [Otarine gammaherpesvirus 4]